MRREETVVDLILVNNLKK